MRHFVEEKRPEHDAIYEIEHSRFASLLKFHPVIVLATVPIIGLAYVLLLPITVTLTVIGLGLTRLVGDMFV